MAGPLGGPADASSARTELTWSSLSPSTSPPGLIDAAAAYDSADSTVVVFGGRLADGALSDRTWVWNGSVWSQPEQYVASPPPRQSASMAFDTALDPPRVILFGGRGDDGVLLDDTWTWNGSSWNQVATSSTPGGRQGAAMTADPHGNLLLFGGYGTTTDPVPSTSTTTSALPATTAPRPSSTLSRRSSTTTSRPSSTTASSARSTATVPTSTTTTTRSTASSAVPDTQAPTARTPTARTPTAQGPTEPSATAAGPGRSGALDKVVAEPLVLDDTWILSASDHGVGEWRRLPTTNHPPPTTDASMATGSPGQTVLFGGTSREPDGDQAAGTSGQTWVWTGRFWSEPKVATSPPGRQDASLTDDSGVGATVLFGGLGRSGALGDTWLWSGSTWRRAAVGSVPSPRAGAAVAYDADSFQLVAFGGASATGAAMSATDVLSTQAPVSTPTPISTPRPGTSTDSSTPSTAGSHTGRAASTPSSSPGAATGPSVRPARVTDVYRGGVVVLHGSGFLALAEITITFHSRSITVAWARADAAGSFRVAVAVPTQVPAGNHHFEASGMGPHGLTTLTTPVRVVARPAHQTSWMTELTLMAIAAAIPLLSWGALSLSGRRGRPAAA